MPSGSAFTKVWTGCFVSAMAAKAAALAELICGDD